MCVILIFTVLETETEKFKKVVSIHLKRTILNLLYVSVNHVFMKNNRFPKNKNMSELGTPLMPARIEDSYILRCVYFSFVALSFS